MILIRTHAAEKIGFGHLVRSSRLADLLKSKNEIVFLINNKKETRNFLKLKKFAYKILGDSLPADLPDTGVKLIIFDLRFFSNTDMQLIKTAKDMGINTVQFTDLRLELQETNYVIDASISKSSLQSRSYSGALLGTEFCILHHKFRHFYLKEKSINKKIAKIFVSLGGSVPYRQLRRVIDILHRNHFRLKISPGFTLKKNQIKTLRRIYPGISFVGRVESLARNFYTSDLSICASGISAYEAACCGCPALYFYYNKEQEITADYFETKGAGFKISSLSDIDNDKLLGKIKELNRHSRGIMSRNAKEITDGKGIYRIIDFFKNLNIINI
jgi:spore coat polysaccharide biosynthesis predicted glycosyltransferase SpsG